MTFDTAGLTEKRNQRGTKYYVNIDGEIISKICGKCGKDKKLGDFYKQKGRLGDRRANCKECLSNQAKNKYANDSKYRNKVIEQGKNWAKNNVTRHRELNKKWVRNNYDKYMKCVKRWQANNKDVMKISMNRYIARKMNLKNSLTKIEWGVTLTKFDESCALSGERKDLHADHVLPVSIGHGGTIYENIIPLRADLNISKSDRNIFDWFADNRERFRLEQRRFDELIEYLADINDMTTKEYEEYVRWCHDNPRTIDEIKAEEDADGASA